MIVDDIGADSECLEGYIRDESFSQELLLELLGLKAFLSQKLITMEAEEEKIPCKDMPSLSKTSAVDVDSYVRTVESLIKLLKKVKAILLSQLQPYGNVVDR